MTYSRVPVKRESIWYFLPTKIRQAKMSSVCPKGADYQWG
jgi:hypothetical protein